MGPEASNHWHAPRACSVSVLPPVPYRESSPRLLMVILACFALPGARGIFRTCAVDCHSHLSCDMYFSSPDANDDGARCVLLLRYALEAPSFSSVELWSMLHCHVTSCSGM